ncbi:hypothetical protein F5877DRAFT_63860 [Lentinula edodes]|nr:hypothetical protein F5877DRAFT_63860 [Lentinula edodes]
MPTADEPHIIVDNTMGAAFIGVICAASLYGVQDLWYIKCLASLLLNRGASFSKKDLVYFYVVTNFSNPTEQAKLVCFLTMRVWKMSNQNKPLTLLIVLFVLGELGCSVAFTISSLKLVTWKDLTNLKSLSMTVNVLGAVSDVIIAAGLFYFLHRSRTGFKKSDTMISKLCLRCGFTAVFWEDVRSILALSTVRTLMRISKVYSNSLLATLNARKGIRRVFCISTPGRVRLMFLPAVKRGLNVEEGDNVSVSLQTFSNKLRLRPMRNMTMAPNQTNISIKVDTTQELVRDKATKEKDFEFDITDVGKSEDTQSEVV